MEHTGRQRPQPCTDKATWDHQELEEEGRTAPLQAPLEGGRPCPHLDFRHWPPGL